jgi:integrase
MTRAKKKGWSYSTGERGVNRVRVFEHPATSRIFLEYTEERARKRLALGHRDRDAATAKADEVALALRQPERVVDAASLCALFDNYLREVTPLKGQSTQSHDRRAAKLFLQYLGPHRRASTLTRRDQDGFVRWRRQGGDTRKGRKSKGRIVRTRVIVYDLKLLHAVLNWAVAAGFVDRNPLKGVAWPKEEAPRRPVLTDEQLRNMVRASREVHPVCELALVLAHETGHRIGAIRLLRWPDVDLQRETIRWRGENDKIGFDHETLLTSTAVNALERARRERPCIGDTWLFSSPENAAEPCSRHLLRDWWQRLEELAQVPHQPGLGWHALRRKFATELKHVPLKDLCYLGGWKDPQTVLKCYQRPDETTMREALASRKPLVVGAES